MPAETGDLVAGRYRLIESAGQGGFGRVWRARDQVLDREVAVKEVLFPPQLPEAERAELASRTVREAQAAARLDHPGVITVYDVIEYDGSPWIVMQFVDGRSLGAEIAASGPLPWQRVAEIGRQIADALADAHAAGIVHRDLKPDNILLARRGAIVTDFGIARILDATSLLTGIGQLIGTPYYMAPEQLDGGTAGTPADLWALGATLYTAAEGVPPFDGPTLTAVITAVLTRTPDPSVQAGPVMAVIDALLAKDPAQRPDARTAARLLADCLPAPASASAPVGEIAPPSADEPVAGGNAGDRAAADRRGPTEVIALASHPPTTEIHPDGLLEPGPAVDPAGDERRPRGRLARVAAVALVVVAGAAVAYALLSSPASPAATVKHRPTTTAVPFSSSSGPGRSPSASPTPTPTPTPTPRRPPTAPARKHPPARRPTATATATAPVQPPATLARPTAVTSHQPIHIELGCALSTTSPRPGTTITLTYTITLSQGDTVGLGAGIYNDVATDYSTGVGDIDSISLPAGSVSRSRPVPIPAGLAAGSYEIDAEMWPPNEVGQDGANTIAEATCGHFTVR